jgi:hypothetical protein
VARLAGGYLRFVLGLWQASRAHLAIRARRRRTARHELRLAELAEERNVPVATLRAIDHLRRMPITRSMGRVCRMLMIDRMALSVFTVLASLVVALWGGWPWGFVGGGGTLALGLYGGEAVSRRVPRDPSMALATVPERIRKIMGTPIVVFGHTHAALRLPLSGGGVYINGGTWLPAIRPGLLRAFTHVVILHGKAGPEVHLRQWRDGRSRPFEAAPADATPIPASASATPPDGVPAIVPAA